MSIKNVNISIGFLKIKGACALYLGNKIAGTPIEVLPEKKKIVCSYIKFPLLPAKYTLN